MRFTALSLLFAGLATAAPLGTSEDVAFLESRQISPNLKILALPDPSGTGCPRGTASVVFDPWFQSFTINFDEYFVQTGPAPLKPSDSIKFCKVTVLVGFTKGLTFVALFRYLKRIK